MKHTIETKIWAGFTIALVIMCAVAIGAFRNTARQQEASKWVEHTYQVIQRLDAVLAAAIDIETGGRGFVMTGDERFLYPFESGIAIADSEFTTLKLLLLDNPQQVAYLDTLESLIRQKIIGTQDGIDTKRSGMSLDRYYQKMIEGGNATMRQIRSLVKTLRENEAVLLAARLREEHTHNQFQLLFILLGNVIAIFVVVYAGFSIHRDMKRRKQAEQALQDGLNFLDSVVENIPNMIFVKDAEDLRFVRFNKAGEELLGMSEEELIGKSDYDFFAKDQADFFVSHDRKVIENGTLLDIPEEQIETRVNGTRILHTKKIPVLGLDGRPKFLLGISEDITEQKKAESQINRFFELSVDLLCIASQSGYFLKLNPSWEKVLGYTEAELTQKLFIEFVHPDDREATLAEMSKLSSGGTVHSFENRYLCKDGSYRTLLWNASPSLSDGAIYAVAHDITDRKRTEQEISILNETLLHRAAALSSSNKELEAFSYSVSHDLRTPLRSIDGFSQALLDDYAQNLDDTGRDYLRRVRAAAQRMSNLIDDLLQLSRITRAEIRQQETNLSDIARTVIDELKMQNPHRKVTVSIQDNLWAYGDPRLLQVAMQNLLGNAWKYSSREDEAIIEFGVAMDKPGQTYYVRDNGVGFDMAFAGKLFGAFERLHAPDEFEGTGVGLATVHRIIRRHGGDIWAESTVGSGATFYFTIGLIGTRGGSHGQQQGDSTGRGQSRRRTADLASAQAE